MDLVKDGEYEGGGVQGRLVVVAVVTAACH